MSPDISLHLISNLKVSCIVKGGRTKELFLSIVVKVIVECKHLSK